MARPDKAAAVAELTDAFRESNAAVLTEYRGLTVAQLKELRRSLAGNATYNVVKNTLTKIAAKDAGVDALDSLLEGPSAIAFVTGDPVEVAKSLRDFGRNNPLLVVKGGVLDGKALSADDVRKLADLESREVLLAKLAGAMKASLSQAVYLLNAPLAQAARLLGALEVKAQEDPSVIGGAGAAQATAAATETPVAADDAEPETPTDGTPGVEETPDTTVADAADDPGAAAQAVADATDVPADTDVAGDATSTS
jgi:large subunit ribosomal protein L10